MKHFEILITRQAEKDAKKIKRSGLEKIVRKILKIIKINPFENPPPYEKLEPPLSNMYSRRINKQHRLVYTVDKKKRIIKVIRMWTHYE